MPRPDSPGPAGASSAVDGPSRFAATHFRILVVAVLALAAFNLTFRLDEQAITEWDESLYGLSAAEMLDTGDWVATRFLGRIDYYNAKPPLNVWLIALCFKALGISPLSLRLVAVVSAWLTVLVLIIWTRRIAGPLIALVAGVVLSTSFGFIYVHSARTANTDALYALLMLLTAIVLHRSIQRPWQRLWLGPLFASVFLLRGPAVLMPLAIAVLIELWNRPARGRWMPLGGAALLFAIPSGLWMLARWRVDQWKFIEQLWSVDLVARTLSPLEGHTGSWFFYLDVLQKYQYDWLIAATVALMLFPPSRQQWRAWLAFPRGSDAAKAVIACWGLVALAVPTIMQTKASWYLNPFYPVFALAIAVVLCHAGQAARITPRRARLAALLIVITMAAGTAEGKLLYQTYRRDAAHSLQGLMYSERTALAGYTVFRSHWNHAERFVVTRLIGARIERLHQNESFVNESKPGDFLVSSSNLSDPRLEKVRESGGIALYRRMHKRQGRR